MIQTVLPLKGVKRTQAERFDDFHRDNPQVYRLLVKFARDAKNAGQQRYSIDALMHRLRWHYRIEVKTEEPYKLNNDFTSHYSRLIQEKEPDLRGFFATRKKRAA